MTSMDLVLPYPDSIGEPRAVNGPDSTLGREESIEMDGETCPCESALATSIAGTNSSGRVSGGRTGADSTSIPTLKGETLRSFRLERTVFPSNSARNARELVRTNPQTYRSVGPPPTKSEEGGAACWPRAH